MDIYRVALIGHRVIHDIRHVENALDPLIRKLIREKEFVEFYIGRNGDFDIFAASMIKRATRESGRGNSTLSLVLPYTVKNITDFAAYYDDIIMPLDPSVHFKAAITERNRWMIDRCDLLIAYVNTDHGGAYDTVKYAEKKGLPIKNLAHTSFDRDHDPDET